MTLHPSIIFVFTVKVKMSTCNTGVHTERGSVVMATSLEKLHPQCSQRVRLHSAGYSCEGIMLLFHILDHKFQFILNNMSPQC